MKRTYSLYTTLLMLAAILMTACESPTTHVKIVCTSDVHGNLFPYDFLHNSPDLRYDEKAILRAYAQVVNSGMLGTTTDAWNAERFTELTGVKVKEKGYAAYPEEGALRHALNTKLLPTALALIWMRCDREVYHSWSDNWQDNEGLDYKLDERQALLYELLTACGYRMCLEEKQYMDGTHEIYRKWVEE